MVSKNNVIMMFCSVIWSSIFLMMTVKLFAAETMVISSQPPQILPSFNTIGFQIGFSGDDDQDGSATIRYRQSGETWQEGHPCIRVGYSNQYKWAGRITHLEAGKQYEIEVTFVDPDGVAGENLKIFTVTSKSKPGGTIRGEQTSHVSPSVDDGNNDRLFSSSVCLAPNPLNKFSHLVDQEGAVAENSSATFSFITSKPDQQAESKATHPGGPDVDSTVETTLGSAIFPFGFMSVESDNLDQLGAIADLGVKYIHSWDYQDNVNSIQKYLNLATAKNLNVIQQLPGEGNPITNEDYWASYIPALAAHDNLAAWYLPDEIPDYDPHLEYAKNLYNWVKKYDPSARPVYGNAGSEDLNIIKSLIPFTDVIWFAAFSIYYGKPRVYVTWSIKERMIPATQNTQKPFGIIIEFFDPKSWGGSGAISTAEEIRCDVYQSLIAGARGIWFYSWHRGIQANGHEPALNEIAKMADEILGSGGLKEIFLSSEKKIASLSIISGPSQSPSVNGKKYDSIQWTQREYNGKEYLFAVNVATQAVTARFSSLPVQSGQSSVLFEQRALTIDNSQFTDTFNPYEVHLYELDVAATIDVNDNVLDHFELLQNYPNPFNPKTEIKFSLPGNAFVDLSIFNSLGESVATLVHGDQSSGWKSVEWDGKDKNSQMVSSGVYFCRLKAGEFSNVIRMLLVR